jgi:hypothetical protein
MRIGLRIELFLCHAGPILHVVTVEDDLANLVNIVHHGPPSPIDVAAPNSSGR